MGQTRPVTAIKLMINDSIELKLDEIQKKKANLAQLSLKNMSRKELMAQKVSQAGFIHCNLFADWLRRRRNWPVCSGRSVDAVIHL